RGKTLGDIRYRLPDVPAPFRKNIKRHPFGVLMFGSATTEEPAYTAPVETLSEMVGQRGWRLVTGAGCSGCMGAMDKGFARGKDEFNKRYRAAEFKPAHIGISTPSILRLEGPPKDLDQLIITNDIYDRMSIMIQGRNHS